MNEAGPPAGPGSGEARLEARVVGLVQGVGFRYWARREAVRLGLRGWVANREDGSVEAQAEGPRSDLETFAERLSVGPPGSSVRDVDLRWGEALGGSDGFAIRSGSHPGD